MASTVLIVDDESSILFSLSEAMADAGYKSITCVTGEEALREVKESLPNVVLLDMKLPDIDGLKVLKKIKTIDPNLPVIMMSAYVDISTAVKAIKMGAHTFVEKPLNIEKIKMDIKNTIENYDVKKELEQFQEVERFRQKVNNPLEQIMGDSPVIKKLKSTILKIVESKATTVLIQGESGTGKELVARAIHYASNRRLKPFIDINCTSIPDELLESELFGHEKGAFTDAKKEKKGLFELSNGGTLFLDEIGDMKTAMQAKLLRVLQEKNFTRVGGTKKIYVDVRIVAATNKDLEKAITNGQFREDLYYRLNVVRVECPPLRDRGKDILLLAKFFINQFNLDFNKSVTKIDPLAENLLVSYNWKGNVRELKNVLERAILLESEDILMPEDLSINSVIERLPSPVNQLVAVNEDLTLEEMEKWLIEKTLQRLLWNKNLVAKKLGINRTTLYTKIKKYNLERS